jgi:hypothetical protein
MPARIDDTTRPLYRARPDAAPSAPSPYEHAAYAEVRAAHASRQDQGRQPPLQGRGTAKRWRGHSSNQPQSHQTRIPETPEETCGNDLSVIRLP